MKKFFKTIAIITVIIFSIWLIPTILAAILGTLATLIGGGAGILVIVALGLVILAALYLILSPIIACVEMNKSKHYKRKAKKISK